MSMTFADEPLASDSEQFGLARAHDVRPPQRGAIPGGRAAAGSARDALADDRAYRLPAFDYCHTSRRRRVRELKRANEILLAASSSFARELDPRLPW